VAHLTLPPPAASAAPAPARLDPEREVADDLVLETFAGVVPALARELEALPGVTVRERRAASVAVRLEGAPRALVPVLLATAVGIELVPPAAPDLGAEATGAPDPAARAAAALAASRERGLAGALRGELAFRVGASVPERWAVRDAVGARLGWPERPRAWELNLEAVDGALVAQVGALHRPRRLGALERIPASAAPVLAAYAALRAGVPDGDVVLDPFCGAGTMLVEAARRAQVGELVGLDLDAAALEVARRNLDGPGDGLLPRTAAPVRLEHADARAVPLPDGAVDRVVTNLPFGKRVGRHRENEELYRAAAGELARVLRVGGRAALVTEHKRPLRDAIAAEARLRAVDERVVDTGKVQPSVFVVERVQPRRPRRHRGV